MTGGEDDAWWRLSGHACRACGARVLEREGAFRCSTCRAASEGDVAAICGCGMLPYPAGRAAVRGQCRPGAGPLGCLPNPRVLAANPAEVVIGLG
jgi:hypothetical protein